MTGPLTLLHYCFTVSTVVQVSIIDPSTINKTINYNNIDNNNNVINILKCHDLYSVSRKILLFQQGVVFFLDTQWRLITATISNILVKLSNVVDRMLKYFYCTFT